MAILSEQRTDFVGDFLGFTFNDYHSSVFGITRVSSSNRYGDNLLPTIQDKTIQTPGADGTYYFGSYYTQKQFTLQIAFDSISEKQLRRLSEVFGDKGIHDLIFDESPYKIYSVKCTGQPQLKYICFDQYFEKDQDGTIINKVHRVYKGEGTLQFTAYYPFARSRFHTLNEKFKLTIKDLDGIISEYNNSVIELSEMQKENYVPELLCFSENEVNQWNSENFIKEIEVDFVDIQYNRLEGSNVIKNLSLQTNEIKNTYKIAFRSSFNNYLYTTSDQNIPYNIFYINIFYPFIMTTTTNEIKKYKINFSLRLIFHNPQFSFEDNIVSYVSDNDGKGQVKNFLHDILNFNFISELKNGDISYTFIFDADDEKKEKTIDDSLVFMQSKWNKYFPNAAITASDTAIQLKVAQSEEEYLIFNKQSTVSSTQTPVPEKEFDFFHHLYDIKLIYILKAPNDWHYYLTQNDIHYTSTVNNNGINDEYYLLFKINSTYNDELKITSIESLNLGFGLNNNYIRIEIPTTQISSNEQINYLKLDKKTNLLIGCNSKKQEMPKFIFNNFIKEGTFKNMVKGNNNIEVIYYDKTDSYSAEQEFYYNELYY